MKIFRFAIFVIIFSMIFCMNAIAQPETDEDKTLSPYFFVQGDSPDVDQLPLKSTSAAVSISGVIADVVVKQVYENAGKQTLEALYVFPASTRAAVYAMKMTIGERTIQAKIKERQEAREAYEQAKAEGKSASLLEQQRPNVFQMNVANILPGDVITVELKYTELLVPTDKVYEFVYPTVVGPRYVDKEATGLAPNEKWTQNPYLHQGEAPPYAFDISVNLTTGMPIRDIATPSHKTNISYASPDKAAVSLDPSEKNGGNRDFILKYRLAGDAIDTGLILAKGKEENFFLMMVQPPQRVKTDGIPPREYVFIVDVSGSMNGYPLDISKKLLKDLISGLRPTDMFNVLLFAGGSSLLSESSMPATLENVQKAVELIDNQRGGGGTEILPALERALALGSKEKGVARTIVVVTDGYVAVEKEAFDLIRNRLGEANMFAFGIGSSVNRYIIEGMARVGMGEPFVITKPEEAPARAEAFRKLIATPVLTDVKVDFGKFEVYDVEPPAIPDVLADRPVIVFGKWRGNPQGTIRVTGKTGEADFIKEIKVPKKVGDETHAALRSLWARHRIAVLSDYQKLSPSDERKQEVTQLGLKYNLLTDYTSFVAIDERVRTDGQKPVTVQQPLPLPQGVSDLAVGGRQFRSMKLAAPSASPMIKGRAGSSLPMRDLAIKEEVRPEKPASSETDSEPKAEMIAPFKLRRIKTSSEIDETRARKIIENNDKRIYACLNQYQDNSEVEVAFKITVDQSGRITSLEIVQPKKTGKELADCLREAFKNITFEKAGKEGEILVVFKRM